MYLLVALLTVLPVQEVARSDDVPVGIAFSRDGRLFFAYSRAIDPKEPISVAEWKSGKPSPYPPGFRQDKGAPAHDRLLSVQALTVDARDRLWILDTAKVGQEPVQPGAPKLLAVDLSTNKVVQRVNYPADVCGPTCFTNDVVIDLSRGPAGYAFITDSSFDGPNGIIVVDLQSGKSWRRLNDHPSTKPAPGFVATVEGQPLIAKGGTNPGRPIATGADGIALAVDGTHLYYSPLSSHRLYRVDRGALADRSKSDDEVAKTVEDLGDKGFAADGMLGDAQGRLYSTDYENGAIQRRDQNGEWTVVAQDPRMLWPDSLALAPDGTLYFTNTQIERGERVRGKDERERPFRVFGVKTDSRPLTPEKAKPQGRAAPRDR
jgi:sugar lactone lactonase YvrE